jgi:hypothetical protein
MKVGKGLLAESNSSSALRKLAVEMVPTKKLLLISVLQRMASFILQISR